MQAGSWNAQDIRPLGTLFWRNWALVFSIFAKHEIIHTREIETSTEQDAYEIPQDIDPNDPYGLILGALQDRY